MKKLRVIFRLEGGHVIHVNFVSEEAFAADLRKKKDEVDKGFDPFFMYRSGDHTESFRMSRIVAVSTMHVTEVEKDSQ